MMRFRRDLSKAVPPRLFLAVCAVVIGLTGLSRVNPAGAQSAKDSSLYAQGQQMVANGDAASGRKLIDSVAARAPTGSAAYAEGLFWRATVAANARDSEHEYRQIIVDYPLSGRVPDALLRIGQLESARGENAAALQHFQRLVLEHPSSPLRADASYWVARMYFEANDATRGCTANADALTSVRASNVELKNRIDFQQQRCRGVTLAANAPAVPTTAPTTAPTTKPAMAAEKAITKTAPKAVAESAQKAVDVPVIESTDTPVIKVAAGSKSAGTAAVVSRPPTREEVARALASAERPQSSRAAKAVVSKTVAPSTSPEPTEPAPAKSTGLSSGSWAVQVAAFGTRAPATQFAAKLKGRGYDAYIDGTSPPYRARIGHYPSHAAAVAALAKLRAKHIDGFVVER